MNEITNMDELFDDGPAASGAAPEGYVPPVLKKLPKNQWPDNACTGCRNSLWHAFKTKDPDVFRLKAFCGAMHFTAYDSHDTGAQPVVVCDGAFEKP